MTEPLDLLVLGSGVAGLSAAVRAAGLRGPNAEPGLRGPNAEPGLRGPNAEPGELRVGVLTKGQLDQATTRWAQGGVAAVLGGDPDSTDLHLADTLAAGAGLCDSDAVRVLVDEGPYRVHELISLGAVFDRDAAGRLVLAREGGHSVARVVHAGGAATGMEIERALVDAVKATAASVMEGWFAVDFLVRGGECRGVEALDPQGRRHQVRARNTLVATGGAGQVYAVTTNPHEATGDGIAMALRAGVSVADLEFVQFHPTALHHPQMPRPLLSEALRGHGALLRDTSGERFVDELAPRDVVARAMAACMAAQRVDHLWLDATVLTEFDRRFPTIAAAVRAAGLDPTNEWLPVAPAAHYFIGGILTDLDGATTLPGLWAAGEAACTGVHGANRLGSNSLLEGMVFGARTVEAIAEGRCGPVPTGLMRALEEGEMIPLPVPPVAVEPTIPAGEPDLAKQRLDLQRTMTEHAGVLRSAESLARTCPTAAVPRTLDTPEAWEERNLVIVAAALVAAAAAREESRGAHSRTDFPYADPAFARRIVLTG